ncbi:Uracil nucleotide/cysteinyl leukotriene receptor [Oryzias melastigma]|uniref:Uracil nucleotide/cysteinyl leukotriene receptor n=2 Tax=Oryzias melastigma TaxID=30732 RepID=A0A834BWQ0_ORYME|nr:Uracil nucleotide/cysteinyl leukotriene receptor [Oryzias melastigma]
MLLSAAPGQSLPAMNVSEEDAKPFDSTTTGAWNISLSGFYILIFIVAVPGNILALWAFCKQKTTSPSKIFLRNLAIADICYVLVLPMRIVFHLSDGYWPFGHVLCQLSGFLFYLNMYCSLYTMSFISLDRVLAVVLPLKLQSVRKPLYANIAVVALWVVVLVSMSPILFSKNQTNSTSICSKLYLEDTSPKALVSTVVAFLIPLTTIVVSYILILLKLRKLKQPQLHRVKEKAAKMIILILINFMLAFMPYHVSRVIYITSQSHSMWNQNALVKANQITSALTCISGILDPVMYFYLNRVYKNTFLQLFCKNKELEKSSGSRSGLRGDMGGFECS